MSGKDHMRVSYVGNGAPMIDLVGYAVGGNLPDKIVCPS